MKLRWAFASKPQGASDRRFQFAIRTLSGRSMPAPASWTMKLSLSPGVQIHCSPVLASMEASAATLALLSVTKWSPDFSAR